MWTHTQSSGKDHVRVGKTPRIIVGVVAVACAVICVILASFMTFGMVDQVNEKLPEAEKFAWLSWYPSKGRRLFRKYTMLYPAGQLLTKVRILTVLMFACGFVAAWGFGFFAK